jgi:hypothetical protein
MTTRPFRDHDFGIGGGDWRFGRPVLPSNGQI